MSEAEEQCLGDFGFIEDSMDFKSDQSHDYVDGQLCEVFASDFYN